MDMNMRMLISFFFFSFLQRTSERGQSVTPLAIEIGPSAASYHSLEFAPLVLYSTLALVAAAVSKDTRLLVPLTGVEEKLSSRSSAPRFFTVEAGPWVVFLLSLLFNSFLFSLPSFGVGKYVYYVGRVYKILRCFLARNQNLVLSRHLEIASRAKS
jgi:hypothetical protein